MNFSDYVLENLQLKNELDSLRYAIHNSIEAYERLGEVTNFEGQPLIYAQVLLDLGEVLDEQTSDAVVRCECGTSYLNTKFASSCPECGY